MAELNGKQERFCQEYIIDLNATQAAIRAGYSEDTARAIGCENLTKPAIEARVNELKMERLKRLNVNQDYVLMRLIEIDQLDVLDILNDDGSCKPIKEWPKVWRQFISGIDLSELKEISGNEEKIIGSVLKKIKWPDKVKNLELIGKHIDVGAFKDKMDLNIQNNPLEQLMKEIAAEAQEAG